MGSGSGDDCGKSLRGSTGSSGVGVRLGGRVVGGGFGDGVRVIHRFPAGEKYGRVGDWSQSSLVIVDGVDKLGGPRGDRTGRGCHKGFGLDSGADPILSNGVDGDGGVVIREELYLFRGEEVVGDGKSETTVQICDGGEVVFRKIRGEGAGFRNRGVLSRRGWGSFGRGGGGVRGQGGRARAR